MSRAPRDYIPSSSDIIINIQQQRLENETPWKRGGKIVNGTPSDDEIVSDSINGLLCCFVSRTFPFLHSLSGVVHDGKKKLATR